MLYECQLATGDFFLDDPYKIGYINVRYLGRVFSARPMLPFGEFRIPTKEWIDKYAKPTDDNSSIGIYCQKVNDSDNFVWTGYTIYSEKLPIEASTNYSYRRVRFTENWIEYFDDKPDNNVYKLVHSDGTEISIDRTNNSENIRIFDGKFSNEILMDKNGVKINGHYVVLDPMLDWINQNKANLVTGNQGAPAPLSSSALPGFVLGMQQFNEFKSKRM